MTASDGRTDSCGRRSRYHQRSNASCHVDGTSCARVVWDRFIEEGFQRRSDVRDVRDHVTINKILEVGLETLKLRPYMTPDAWMTEMRLLVSD